MEKVVKKAGVHSENNKRASIKRLMNVNEAKVVCQWRTIVSVYLNGKPMDLYVCNS